MNVTSMEGLIESSLKLLEEAEHMARDIPPDSFEKAFGIVIMESVQAAFLFSAQVGTGILVRHDQETGGWSAPLAIGLTGGGVGLAMGAEKKHMIVFLNESQMDQTAMTNNFSIQLGLEQSYALGPAGEANELTATIGNKGTGVSTGYATSVGIYTGLQAGGTALAPRTAINKKFYGEKLSPKEILYGDNLPSSLPLKRLHARLDVLTARGREGKSE